MYVVCRILTSGCSGITTISTVRVRFKVRVRDRFVKGMKCPRTEVTVHQFGPIYPTELIAVVQCMFADYVVWDGGCGDPSMGLGRGKFVFWRGGIRQHSVGLTYRKNVALRYGWNVPRAEWLDLSTMDIVHAEDKCILCHEGWQWALPKLLKGGLKSLEIVKVVVVTACALVINYKENWTVWLIFLITITHTHLHVHMRVHTHTHTHL